MIVIRADALIDAPLSVADTVRFATPPEFPAVNVVEIPLVVEMLPSLLFRDHV